MAKKKPRSKEKGQKTQKEKTEDFKLEVSQTASDVKTFIKKFKSDIDRKRKGYKTFAQKFREKKS